MQRDVSGAGYHHSVTLHLYAGDHGYVLTLKLASLIQSSSISLLESPWVVVPSTAMRSRLDWDLASPDLARRASEVDLVSSNFTYFFPEQLVAEIESRALANLGEVRIDWRPEVIALALMKESLGRLSWREAISLASTIDEQVRWRPDEGFPEMLDTPAAALLRSELWLRGGPGSQRHKALAAIAGGGVGLPKEIYVYGLTMPSGGQSFIELLKAVGQHTDVHVMLSLPSLHLLNEDEWSARDDVPPVSWTRDALEALALWRSSCGEPERLERSAYAAVVQTEPSLLAVQTSLAAGGLVDHSIETFQIVGAFGASRQAEVCRDLILDVLNDPALDIAPHEILVVSPRLEDFATVIERHWNFAKSAENPPRLAYEITETPMSALDDRAHFLEALLALTANYVLPEQVAHCVGFSCFQAAKQLEEADVARMAKVVSDGKVTFGLDVHHRLAFDLFPQEGDEGVGTWERLLDRLALTAVMPDDVADPDQLGVADDAVWGAALFSLLAASRTLTVASGGGEVRSLSAWLAFLDDLLAQLLGDDAVGDGSVQRIFAKVREWSASLIDPPLSLRDVIALWRHLMQSGAQSNLFGARGVHVAPLNALPAASYRMVVVLGCDEERFPAASLRSATLVDRREGDPNPRRSVLGALLQSLCAASHRAVILYTSHNELTGEEVKPPMVIAELLEHFHGAKDLVRHTPRHSFVRSASTPEGPASFDHRARELSDTVLSAGKATPGEVLRRGAVRYLKGQALEGRRSQGRPLTIRVLHAFARSAPKVFIERSLRGSPIPDHQEAMEFPSLKIGALERYSVMDELYERAFAHFGYAAEIDQTTLSLWLQEILQRESVARHIPQSLLDPIDIPTFAKAFDTLRLCLKDFVPLTDEEQRRWPPSITTGMGELDVRMPEQWTVSRGYSKFVRGEGAVAPLSTYRYEKSTKGARERERDLVAMMSDVLILRVIGGDEEPAPVAMTFNPPKIAEAFQTMTGLRFIGSQSLATALLDEFLVFVQSNDASPVPLTREIAAWVFRDPSEKALNEALRDDLAYASLRTLFPENGPQFRDLMASAGLNSWLQRVASACEHVVETAKKHKVRDAPLQWSPLLVPSGSGGDPA